MVKLQNGYYFNMFQLSENEIDYLKTNFNSIVDKDYFNGMHVKKLNKSRYYEEMVDENLDADIDNGTFEKEATSFEQDGEVSLQCC